MDVQSHGFKSQIIKTKFKNRQSCSQQNKCGLRAKNLLLMHQQLSTLTEKKLHVSGFLDLRHGQISMFCTRLHFVLRGSQKAHKKRDST